VDSDSGAQIRDGKIKSVGRQGDCTEESGHTTSPNSATAWPRLLRAGPEAAGDSVPLGSAFTEFDEGLSRAERYPFVFGVSVYNSFVSDEVVPDRRLPLAGAWRGRPG